MNVEIEKVNREVTIGVSNLVELEAEILKVSERYKNAVYDISNIGEAREDRAKLNKFKKALDDARKLEKKKALEPYTILETQIKERLIEPINEAISSIDGYIEEADERYKAGKKTQIMQIWGELDRPIWLCPQRVFNEKWLNKTCSLNAIREELAEIIETINNDISTLEGLDFGFEAVDDYKKHLDLNRAIAEGQRLKELAARKLEAERRKEEAAAMQKEEPEAEELKAHETEEPPEEIPEEKNWISFKAYITISQAKKLRVFCNENDITLKRI